MKVRLIGTPDEVTTAVNALAAAMTVVEVSSPYPCRGGRPHVRVYVTVTTR